MPLHYLDPSREPRPCPYCRGGILLSACAACLDTGYLGDPEARPDVEVFQYPSEAEWYYMPATDEPHRLNVKRFREWCVPVGPFPTEAAALEAAREAHHKG